MLSINMCKPKKLSRRFFTIGHILKGKWNGQDFVLPKNIVMHHANFTIGCRSKIQLLDLVKNKYYELNN